MNLTLEVLYMDNVYLKFPTLEDKENWIEYIEEYRFDDLNAKPLGCTENINYEEWLKEITNEHNAINLQIDRVPLTVYFFQCLMIR